MSEFVEPYIVGEYRHTLDVKNRLSIPSKWRFDGDEKVTFVVFPHPNGHLMVLPPSEAGRLRKAVAEQSLGDDSAQKWQYKTFSQADSLSLDKNGRFTIPDRLKKRVGIDREVVLVGMMTKFALWSPERWAGEAPDETRDNFSQLMKEARV
jgi:transcriptional regulator MraZ